MPLLQLCIVHVMYQHVIEWYYFHALTFSIIWHHLILDKSLFISVLFPQILNQTFSKLNFALFCIFVEGFTIFHSPNIIFHLPPGSVKQWVGWGILPRKQLVLSGGYLARVSFRTICHSQPRDFLIGIKFTCIVSIISGSKTYLK